MKVQGTIVAKTEPQSYQTKNGTNAQRISVIIAYKDGSYERNIAVEYFGEKAGIAFAMMPGNYVVADFYVSSREWNGKWYTTAVGQTLNHSQPPQIPVAPAPQAPQNVPQQPKQFDTQPQSQVQQMNDAAEQFNAETYQNFPY